MREHDFPQSQASPICVNTARRRRLHTITIEEVINSELPKYEEYRQVESQPFLSEEAFEVADLEEQGLSLKEIAQRRGTTYVAMRQRASRWTRAMKPIVK
jgi:DNA-binding NarL/FixJ family response regulator